jgi:hypothetical protein
MEGACGMGTPIATRVLRGQFGPLCSALAVSVHARHRIDPTNVCAWLQQSTHTNANRRIEQIRGDVRHGFMRATAQVERAANQHDMQGRTSESILICTFELSFFLGVDMQATIMAGRGPSARCVWLRPVGSMVASRDSSRCIRTVKCRRGG